MLKRSDSKSRFGVAAMITIASAGGLVAEPQAAGSMGEPIQVTVEECLTAVEKGTFVGNDRAGKALYVHSGRVYSVYLTERQISCTGVSFLENDPARG